MERRELLTGAAGIALAALAGQALAADDHAHHDAHDHAAHGMPDNLKALSSAAADCINKGQVCLSHCLIVLGEGDTAMAGCAKAVNQMLAICGALQQLANQGSRYAPALARVALDVCQDCEKECRKHEKKHGECKACADACVECAKQCKALAA